jgi:hypothetical protein
MKTIADPKDNPMIKNLGHEALHDLLHFDRKIFRTLPVLLFRPGLLTEKTLGPERDVYVKPFTLFVFINFLFFLGKSKGIFAYSLDSYRDHFENLILKKEAALHITYNILAERFNTAIHFEEKEYLIIMVPLLALVVTILYKRWKLHYAAHLVFALHYYSFLILFLLVIPYLLLPVQWFFNILHLGINLFNSQIYFVLIIALVTFIYLLMALRRIYRQNYIITAFKSSVLSLTVLLLIAYVYRIALFFIVFRSLSE